MLNVSESRKNIRHYIDRALSETARTSPARTEVVMTLIMRKVLILTAILATTITGFSAWALSDKSTADYQTVPEGFATQIPLVTTNASQTSLQPLTSQLQSPVAQPNYRVPGINYIPSPTSYWPTTTFDIHVSPPSYSEVRWQAPTINWQSNNSCHAAAYVCNIYGQ